MARHGSSRQHFKVSPTRGLATPVSTLIIFFSLTSASIVVYAYSINKIGSKTDELKLFAAEEKMLDLESAISSASWSVGSSRVLAFSDYGGELILNPSGNHLTLSVAINESSHVLFNSSTGLIVYELSFALANHVDTWLLGDRRAIVNVSSVHQAQVRIEPGLERQELIAGYRPVASSSLGGSLDGRGLNNIRIYVINLNSSQAFTLEGELYLRILCENVDVLFYTYNVTSSVSSISILSELDASDYSVVIPLTSGPSGSTVRIEVVICQIAIEKVIV